MTGWFEKLFSMQVTEAQPPREEKTEKISLKPEEIPLVALDILKELNLLLRSGYGVLFLEKFDDDQAEGLLRYQAEAAGLPFFHWTPGNGLRRDSLDNYIYGTQNFFDALNHICVTGLDGYYLFHSAHPFIKGEELTVQLKQVAKKFSKAKGAVFFCGGEFNTEVVQNPHFVVVKKPEPKRQDYLNLVRQIVKDLKNKMPDISVRLTPGELEVLLSNLQGLTLIEVEKILTRSIIEDGKLDFDDIKKVIDAKRRIIESDGLLEYFPFGANLSEIAGFLNLKDWLKKRAVIFSSPEKAREFGLQYPKGILILGVPGSGKSLCAKIIAREWHLPLLKMDSSKLYNKYIGETEKNFQRAMQTAEKMSPIVLWIDEIEKVFSQAGNDTDGGTSQRAFGAFLTWMQEKQSMVFVIGTCNDIKRLPPELLRKGRFDEIFFADLPDAPMRREIFSIHLKNRKKDPSGFDLDALVSQSDGFTGAEIEQVIVSSLYTAFSAEASLDTSLILQELKKTVPLSVTRAEHIEGIREWARERTIPV